MLRKIRSRLTYANVMSTIAVFFALGGVAAYADNEFTGANIKDGSLTGQDVFDNTISGNDITNNSVTGTDIQDGSLGTPDIGELHGSRLVNGSVSSTKLGTGAVTGTKVASDTLDSFNIKESTLFHCHGAAVLVGRLCVLGTGSSGNLSNAFNACDTAGMQLPSLAEAHLLGADFDVPGVGSGQRFWTDEITDWTDAGSLPVVVAVDENGNFVDEGGSGYTNQIVCVETPTGLD